MNSTLIAGTGIFRVVTRAVHHRSSSDQNCASQKHNKTPSPCKTIQDAYLFNSPVKSSMAPRYLPRARQQHKLTLLSRKISALPGGCHFLKEAPCLLRLSFLLWRWWCHTDYGHDKWFNNDKWFM